MKKILIVGFALVILVGHFAAVAPQKGTIIVGAKHFNEGYILGEIIAFVLEDAGFEADRRFNLGGTAVTFEGLRKGAIDVYPEYTGTISAEILKLPQAATFPDIQARVRQEFNLEISAPYGFSNTYALLIKKDKAGAAGISTISDLQGHPALRFGISHEFLERQDGWGVLSTFYQLPQRPVALEHGLAYQAILDDRIDVMDAYSTDGEISRYDLLLLEDNRHFFPDYQAVSFYRAELPDEAKAALDRLSSSITAEEMQELNALALFGKESHAKIAHDFLVKKGIIQATHLQNTGVGRDILVKAFVHLQLTLLAVLSAIMVALPLGIYLYRHPRFSSGILYAAGIMQTIPSIALLALMIPLLGIGRIPALVALFLYALLPILRNTVIGLFTVDPQLKKVASAIGLPGDVEKVWADTTKINDKLNWHPQYSLEEALRDSWNWQLALAKRAQ